jgi:histidinol-phosphatase (PHP family)
MPADALPEYFRALHAARDQAGDRLTVRYGVEADYIPETVDQLADILRAYPFDYVIGSIHFVDEFPIDETARAWDALSENERNDMVRAYWSRTTDMAKSGLFDIAAHLDLYKKFGHRPTVDVSEHISVALDAIAESGMAVELNTAGYYRMGEMYPSGAIVSECRKRGIAMLVTTDAHRTEQLLRGIDLGIEALREAGYTRQAVFAERKMTLTDL